jgi:Tfp pilus assembly protein PilZ
MHRWQSTKTEDFFLESKMFTECDKRQYDRMRISLPVFIETSNGFLEGEIENISVGGAFIECANSLSIGKIIYIAIIKIPGLHRHLLAKAQLIWKNNAGCNNGGMSQGLGVKFTKIDEVDQEVILTLVSNGAEEQKNVVLTLSSANNLALNSK